jgi:hypothetical protein
MTTRIYGCKLSADQCVNGGLWEGFEDVMGEEKSIPPKSKLKPWPGHALDIPH